MKITRALVPLCFVLTAGCVSLAPRSQPVGARAVVIDTVPARGWADNSCAAGALSEVLNALGDPVTEQQLSGSMVTGRNGGVTTVDLLLAARSRGFGAQLLRGDGSLVERELALRRPLILMLRVFDAPGTGDDLFHYVVLSGVDREGGLVRMHYGDGKRRWVSLARLDASWSAGGYATILIGPAARTPATEDDLRRAVLLEESGSMAQAILLYRFYLETHPESALVWTNLGNAQAAAGEPQLAEVAYRNALFIDRSHRDALNNLATLLLEQRRAEEAEEFARRAAAQDGPERYLALDTLARVLAAQHRCDEARAVAGEALAAVDPDDQAARGRIETHDRCGGEQEPPAQQESHARGTRAQLAPPSPKPYRTAYAWLTVATIFDVEATFHMLDRYPQTLEGNPITRPIVESGRLTTYAYSMGVNAAVMYLARKLFDRGDPAWRILPIAFTVVHVIAGSWNIYQVSRGEP